MSNYVNLPSGIRNENTKNFIKWFIVNARRVTNSFLSEVITFDEKDGELIYVVNKRAGIPKFYSDNGDWLISITTDRLNDSFRRAYKIIRNFINDPEATWLNSFCLCKATGTSTSVYPLLSFTLKRMKDSTHYEGEREFPADEKFKK